MRREKEKDYLAPFLARLGDKDHLTTEEKERVKEDCLRDAESRQEVVANIIQAHFERVGVVTWWAGLIMGQLLEIIFVLGLCHTVPRPLINEWVVPRPLINEWMFFYCT